MSNIRLDPDAANSVTARVKTVRDALVTNRITVSRTLYSELAAAPAIELTRVREALALMSRANERLSRVHTVLSEGVRRYVEAERSINRLGAPEEPWMGLLRHLRDWGGFALLSGVASALEWLAPGATWQRVFGNDQNGTSLSFLKRSVSDGTWSAAAGEAEWHASNDFVKTSVKAEVGKIDASFKPQIGLWKTDRETGKIEFDPNIGIKMGVAASALSASAKAEYGNDALGVVTKAGGQVGTAEASASAKLDLKDLKNSGVKAEVGAAVFKGKVEGGFKVFGWTVGASAQGEALAVGAGAEFGCKDGAFTIGAHLSALFGGGFSVSIAPPS